MCTILPYIHHFISCFVFGQTQLSREEFAANYSAFANPHSLPTVALPPHSETLPRLRNYSDAQRTMLIRSIMDIHYLNSRFRADGHTIYSLSPSGIFKTCYINFRRVLLIEQMRAQLQLKFCNLTDKVLAQTQSLPDGGHITIQSLLNWAGQNTGSYDNNRRRVAKARAVYNELVKRQDLPLPDTVRQNEMSSRRSLSVLLSASTLDRDDELSPWQQGAVSMTMLDLDGRLANYLQIPIFKHRYEMVLAKQIMYVD